MESSDALNHIINFLSAQITLFWIDAVKRLTASSITRLLAYPDISAF